MNKDIPKHGRRVSSMRETFDLKRSGWIWQVTVLSLVLGMLLAAALKTQQTVKRASGIPTTRVSGLAAALLDEKDRNAQLQQEITKLRAQVTKYEEALGTGTTKTQLLNDELQKAKFMAGLTPAEGPGVEVILRDYPKPESSDAGPELAQQYLIHDVDLRDFVNELIANGAEAIAISDNDSTQRVISCTPIRCDVGIIRVNRVPMAAPFTISAIGPPNALKTALEMPNGLIENFRYIEGLTSKMVQVRKKNHILIPAYSGTTNFIYASIPASERKPK